MIIEWNAHMFHRDTERYSFHPDATYTPAEARRSPDPLQDYLKSMEQRGVDRAVLVHPEPYGDDHSLVLDCLEREPDRLRTTALVYPRNPAAVSKVVQLVEAEPRVVALRFHAHRGKTSYFERLTDSEVDRLWRTCSQLDLIVELHIDPNYAAQAGEMIRRYPDTPVIIDHLAEPHLGTAVEYADVLDLARHDRVYMKLSGLGHFAPDPPLYSSARPLTRWVAAAFGPERMVWGSGTPEIVDHHLSHWSDEERARVKGLNLAKLLDWQDH